MRLSEAISEKNLFEIKKYYSNGSINFKNKNRFLGIHHDAVGGASEVYLSLEMLESDNWGISFQPLDKEFIKLLHGVFNSLGSGNLSNREALACGIGHPCKSKCDGWLAGFNRGLYEASKREKELHEIINSLITLKTKKARDNAASRYRFFIKDVWKIKPEEQNDPSK